VVGADGERIAASIRAPGGGPPRPDRGPRPVHLEPLRLCAPESAVRGVLRIGASTSRPSTLRSFGMTELTSPAPTTGGWEGGTRHPRPLARYMKELGFDERRRSSGSPSGGSSVVKRLADGPGDGDVAGRGHPPRSSPPAIPKLAWERFVGDRFRADIRAYSGLHKSVRGPHCISRVRSGRWAAGGRGHAAGDGRWSRPPTTGSTPRRSGPGRVVSTHVPNAEGAPADPPPPRTDHIVPGRSTRGMIGPGCEPATIWFRVWILPAGLARPAGRAADPRWNPHRLPPLLRALGDIRRALLGSSPRRDGSELVLLRPESRLGREPGIEET